MVGESAPEVWGEMVEGGKVRVTARNASISVAVLGALVAMMVVGINVQQRNDRHVRVDTLDGGRIVVSNPDSSRAGGQAAPTLIEALRIGSLDGTCDAFGEVTSLAVDADGRIYVADRQANEIRLFSPRGECLRTFGRSGDGPGEFSWLAGITWQPPGYLWAIDAIRDRFTVFDSLGTVMATHALRLGRAASLPWPLWVDDERSLHLWLPASRTIVKYGVGPALDSLASFQVPEIPREMYTQRRGGITAQSPIPYSPSIRWTVNPAGNIWLADNSVFALHETTYGGDTLRTLELDHRAPRLAGRERDSLAAVTGIAARRLPARKTVLEWIHSGPDGWVWVETERGAIQGWDVFDERGHYLGRVAPPVPIEKEPFPVFGTGTVTGVTLGELDEAYVVQLQIVH